MAKTIFGTNDDDALDGGSGAEVIVGFAGSDVLSGGNGADILIGDSLFSNQVTLVSTASDGTLGDGNSQNSHFTADGTGLVFESAADNLLPGFVVTDEQVYFKNLVSGQTALVSASDIGSIGNGDSRDASVSADGKYAVFTTDANNLLNNIDGNNVSDVVIKNLLTGQTLLVSAAKDGTIGDNISQHASFSPDGKLVLFESSADNLIANGPSGAFNIYLKNLATGAVRLLSTNGDGDAADAGAQHAVFAATGKMVGFESLSDNLSTADSNGVMDVYAKNLIDNSTMLVSAAKNGTAGNGASHDISFSADGKYAIFTSDASNLVAHDTNAAADVFIKNLETGAITLVSTDNSGTQGNEGSLMGVFSPDGTKVAFESAATNLTDDPTDVGAQVYVKNLITGEVVRVSDANSGALPNDASLLIAWSPDGQHLTYTSNAGNLVAGDSNGASDVFVATVDFPLGGSDTLDGGNGNDTFLPGGGEDVLTGDAGDDIAYFRGQFDGGDRFDGGTGNDTLVLEGDYFEPMYFGAGVINIETILLKGHHTYNLVSVDETVQSGATMVVDGSADDAAHSIRFDGSAEQNGSITFIGGAGNDTFMAGVVADFFNLTNGGDDTATGGAGNDIFYMGAALTAADRLDGGGGVNSVTLDGDYSAGLVFTDGTMTNVGHMTLTAGHSYKLTLTDANATGPSLLVDGWTLGVGQSLRFYGGAETGTSFDIYAGADNDTLTGGAKDDTFHLATGGIDTVLGGDGNDTMDFGATLDSHDRVDGGAGTSDKVIVSALGNGRAPLVLTHTFMQNVETIDLEGGSSLFRLSVDDTLLSPTQNLLVLGSGAGAGLIFNGSAEVSGSFSVRDTPFDDTITTGGGNDDIVMGNGGNDTVLAGGGNDQIVVFTGQNGTETLSGGDGNDSISLGFNPGVYGAVYNISGGAGDDTLEIYAGSGADPILPTVHMSGGAGNDVVSILIQDNAGGTNVTHMTLTGALTNNVEKIVFSTPDTYIFAQGISLVADDSAVSAGRSITLDGTQVDYFNFDGSAEKDGSYRVIHGGGVSGGAGNDTLEGSGTVNGNGGNDVLTGTGSLNGGAGNDILTCNGHVYYFGGAGNDRFVISHIGDPAAGDVAFIRDFDASADKFDLTGAVTGIDAKITSALIDTQNLDTALTNLTAGHLGAHHAMIVQGTGHSLTSEIFLVVDLNGVAGFQKGHDLAIDISSGATHLGNLAVTDFI